MTNFSQFDQSEATFEMSCDAEPVNDHYGNAIGHYGDPSACARSVYRALSPPLEGPGNEAKLHPAPNIR